jgi:hypothetical protein
LSGTSDFNQSYVVRRNKEFLSLLVVRFLRANDVFNGIYEDFRNAGLGAVGHQLPVEGSFYKRINQLEQSLFVDIEAKSRFLFRRSRGTTVDDTEIQSQYDDLFAAFSQIRKSLLNKSLDTNIRKILHILRLLKACLHELEHCDVEYAREHEYVAKLESFFTKFGRGLANHERHELDHIKDIDKISSKIVSDTKNHIRIAMQRCKSLFHETSQILLHVIQEARKNEVLVLNLVRERELIDRIYGFEAHERILAGMYASMPQLGNSGLEKAVNFCRHNCNNTSDLPEVASHLPGDNPDRTQNRKGSVSFKETRECYTQ